MSSLVRYSRYLPLGVILLLQGCGSAPPVLERSVPVVVERAVVQRIAPDLLAPCPSKPDRLVNGVTGGTLRQIALDYQNSYVPCLEGKLESIRRLQPE
jgi:hypothetical protein